MSKVVYVCYHSLFVVSCVHCNYHYGDGVKSQNLYTDVLHILVILHVDF